MTVPTRSVAAALALAFFAFACSSDSPESGSRQTENTAAVLPGEDVAESLCRAATQAADDQATAVATFHEVHDGLHVIARALQEVDRKAAAALLVAKQAVEESTSGQVSGDQLASELGNLAAATRAGLARLDVQVPACSGGPGQ